MDDLIININLDESRKKQGLVIETYQGAIPHLKSKKFSGQLRNVNLSSVLSVNNLSLAELQLVKEVFNDPANIQINKFQYLFLPSLLPKLYEAIGKNCIFCKDKQGTMYEVEELQLNGKKEHLYCFSGFSALQDKTILYINYDLKDATVPIHEIKISFYVDISSVDYQAQLYFDYGNDIIKAGSPSMSIYHGTEYRNYKLEQEAIEQIKRSHWKWYEREAFVYTGSDISYDMQCLEEKGIHLFTNERKKINTLQYEVSNVNYGIDWFEIKGTANAGERTYAISDLIDFRKKRKIWVESNGNILFLPSSLKSLAHCKIEKDGDNLRVSTTDILKAIEAVDSISNHVTTKCNNLLKYTDIVLKLPGNLFETLRDYQKIGVKWLLSLNRNGFGGCLADDMGLGKTIQIIAYLSDETQKYTNALVVVPKTLIENWCREFKKYSPDTSVYIYHGTYRSLDDAKKSRIIITTYGTLLNDIVILNKQKYDHLIIDEAQNIKNSKSKAYRAVAQIKAKTKIIMTGTPLENRIEEYWSLLSIANPTKLTFKTLANGLNNAQIIEKVKRLTSPFLLRRFKKDVLADLPEKQEQIIYCSFDDLQEKLYANMVESIRNEINRSPERWEMKSNSTILNGLLYLQEICCHPRLIPYEYNKNHCYESAKTEQLISMLEDLYSVGHKIVVFSRFTKMLEIINQEVTKHHFNVFYLDGNTINRQKIVDEFESSTDGVFLISLKAGGVGLNLVSADIAIIYDPWWNPAIEKQAEDRIYRIGQRNKVTIYRLIAANTIEEKIQLLQQTKRKLFDDVVEGHTMPKDITVEDIKNLI